MLHTRSRHLDHHSALFVVSKRPFVVSRRCSIPETCCSLCCPRCKCEQLPWEKQRSFCSSRNWHILYFIPKTTGSHPHPQQGSFPTTTTDGSTWFSEGRRGVTHTNHIHDLVRRSRANSRRGCNSDNNSVFGHSQIFDKPTVVQLNETKGVSVW